MSPARARTSHDEIVAAGRELLETGGLEAVTMQAVAAAVGVRAPSLYKRIPGRSALIAAIIDTTLDELWADLEAVEREPEPGVGVRVMAGRYRAFAKAHRRAYALVFADLPPDQQPSSESNARAAEPLLALTERLVGPEHALEAARLVTAFANGFIAMELSGAFRLGGDVDEAFRYGIDAIVTALSDRPLPAA